MKFMSQFSISQAVLTKKSKRSTAAETTSTDQEVASEATTQDYTLNKPSKHLRMLRSLLLHSLHLQLNFPLNKKKKKKE